MKYKLDEYGIDNVIDEVLDALGEGIEAKTRKEKDNKLHKAFGLVDAMRMLLNHAQEEEEPVRTAIVTEET